MRIVIQLIALLALVASTATAQLRLPKDSLDWPTPRNVLAVNPAGIAVDYLSVHYVHAVDGHNAVGGFVTFVYRPIGAHLPRGIGAGALYRFYPASQAVWRFHYGAQLSWLEAWLTSRRDIRASGLGFGMTVGWQWLPIEGFAVGFSVGEQYLAPFRQLDNEALERVFGFRPLLSFDLGLAW